MTISLSTASKLDALGQCTVFAGVSIAPLGVLAEMMDTEKVEAAETLFDIGEPSDRVYVVVSGTLSVFVPGRDAPVRALGRGDLLGEYGMFAGQQRTASVRGATTCTLLSLEYDRFRAFLFQFPAAMYALLSTATQRLVEAERRAVTAGRDSSSSG